MLPVVQLIIYFKIKICCELCNP